MEMFYGYRVKRLPSSSLFLCYFSYSFHIQCQTEVITHHMTEKNPPKWYSKTTPFLITFSSMLLYYLLCNHTLQSEESRCDRNFAWPVCGGFYKKVINMFVSVCISHTAFVGMPLLLSLPANVSSLCVVATIMPTSSKLCMLTMGPTVCSSITYTFAQFTSQRLIMSPPDWSKLSLSHIEVYPAATGLGFSLKWKGTHNVTDVIV